MLTFDKNYFSIEDTLKCGQTFAYEPYQNGYVVKSADKFAFLYYSGDKVVIESDKLCPNCGKKMLVRTSRFGNQFLGCSGYPECKTIISINHANELDSENDNAENTQAVEEKCDKCGGAMTLKTGPYGKYV
jgi:predicted RNA-binding Zn-ribbon protein involved in translation (DUF1610 family)